MSPLRDIDYAATAVKTAIVEKFGRHNSLENLRVIANENTISVVDGEQAAEGTRDNLLAALRKAGSYENLWQIFPRRAAGAPTATTPGASH
jgi:hypothetical protein